jgi:hypothetical protein
VEKNADQRCQLREGANDAHGKLLNDSYTLCLRSATLPIIGGYASWQVRFDFVISSNIGEILKDFFVNRE